MEFWGIEVEKGQTVQVKLGEDKVLHLSQACLGEPKANKPSESVCLHITVEGKKLVLGTLHPERLPQQLFDLVFDKDFSVSHNWKYGTVYFYGYKADQPVDSQDSAVATESEDIDSEEEEEALRLPIPNGNKQEAKNEENQASEKKKEGKQKVKIVEPEKDSKAHGESSESDDSDSDDSLSDGSDSDEDNDDSSDSSEEDSSDDEEETPKKEQSGKKRPNESAIKTPSTDKKAKLSTPQKTDGKKAVGHVATPHPSKQAGKTPANKSNQKSPASAADGAHSCKTCNRNFKSDVALQSHNQAKHK